MIALNEVQMPFPESPRIVYGRNPLIEVICQLRFPAIYRIGAEAPIAFQERVRGDYPMASVGRHIAALPDALAAIIPGAAQSLGRTAYDFVSQDGTWKVGLTQDFVALTTTKYETWGEFRRRLVSVIDPIREIYSPPFFTRIGLRYRDAIERSKLGITDCEWSDLLRPELVAELRATTLAAAVEENAHQFVLAVPDIGAKLRVQHGLAKNLQTEEFGYLIDADFYLESTMEIDNALANLDRFNRLAGHFFRWCITDRLHEAMEPGEPA